MTENVPYVAQDYRWFEHVHLFTPIYKHSSMGAFSCLCIRTFCSRPFMYIRPVGKDLIEVSIQIKDLLSDSPSVLCQKYQCQEPNNGAHTFHC